MLVYIEIMYVLCMPRDRHHPCHRNECLAFATILMLSLIILFISNDTHLPFFVIALIVGIIAFINCMQIFTRLIFPLKIQKAQVVYVVSDSSEIEDIPIAEYVTPI